jgi:hypothetical protein
MSSIVMKSYFKKIGHFVLGDKQTSHLIFLIKYPLYYWRLRCYVSIDGWLGYKEAVYLYKVARSLPTEKPVRVVEIGTWQGKSAIVIGKALHKHPDVHITCIDPFNADGDTQSRQNYQNKLSKLKISLKDMCWGNIKKNKLDHIIEVIQGYSYEVSPMWKDPIDLLFIDGNHDYASVRQDFNEWTPFLIKDGRLVMDDVYLNGGGHQGPAMLVKESIFDNPNWYDCHSCGTLFFASKR